MHPLQLERLAKQACGDTWRNVRNDLKHRKVATIVGPERHRLAFTDPGPCADPFTCGSGLAASYPGVAQGWAEYERNFSHLPYNTSLQIVGFLHMIPVGFLQGD